MNLIFFAMLGFMMPLFAMEKDKELQEKQLKEAQQFMKNQEESFKQRLLRKTKRIFHPSMQQVSIPAPKDDFKHLSESDEKEPKKD